MYYAGSAGLVAGLAAIFWLSRRTDHDPDLSIHHQVSTVGADVVDRVDELDSSLATRIGNMDESLNRIIRHLSSAGANNG
jgi:hypothetical protein